MNSDYVETLRLQLTLVYTHEFLIICTFKQKMNNHYFYSHIEQL